MFLALSSRYAIHNGWLAQSVRRLPAKAIVVRLCVLLGSALLVAIPTALPFLIAGRSSPIVPTSRVEWLLVVSELFYISLNAAKMLL